MGDINRESPGKTQKERLTEARVEVGRGPERCQYECGRFSGPEGRGRVMDQGYQETGQMMAPYEEWSLCGDLISGPIRVVDAWRYLGVIRLMVSRSFSDAWLLMDDLG